MGQAIGEPAALATRTLLLVDLQRASTHFADRRSSGARCRVPAGAHKPNLRLSVDGHCPRELLTDNAVAITIVHVSIGRVTLAYRGDTVRPCLCACNSPVAVVIP